ncbi:MAG TPA: AraC family transcriptional regulator [Terriglobus sp.]
MFDRRLFFCDSPFMSVDPLAEVVTLLQPAARYSKLVECAGSWRICPPGTGEPFYCAVLEGVCTATVDGQTMTLQAGDFVLVPAMRELVNESSPAPPKGLATDPVEVSPGRFRVGEQGGPVALRMQVGHCSFASPDAELLVSLLPQMVIARGEPRLAVLLHLIHEETRAQRSARDLVLQRLLEVMLIEALRCGMDAASAPGLVRGLGDERLAIALRAIHARPEHGWTVAKLAKDAGLSRSGFFARFRRTLGVAPMEYLLSWRMALAKRKLRERELSMEEVAESVGYSSASTFTVAFARHVGEPPARYARTL